MKKIIVILIVWFLVGCGGSSGGTNSEDDGWVHFDSKLLDLREVEDARAILNTFFLEDSDKKSNRSSRMTKASTDEKVYGDKGGYYITKSDCTSTSEVCSGTITYVDYNNTDEDCPSKTDFYNITLKFTYYKNDNKTKFWIASEGTINGELYKKSTDKSPKTFSIVEYTGYKIITYNLTVKINDIYYALSNLVVKYENGSDDYKISYLSGKINVVTSKTNGYFYIKDTLTKFKFDLCDHYLEGKVEVIGKDSKATVEVLNQAPAVTISSYTNDADYYAYQWNINKQSTYQQNSIADSDADINLVQTWQKTKGENVYVAVIDDCFESNHEDLKDNIYLTYNANTSSSDVSGSDCHGTKVASVIGAVADNNKGIKGIAPKVKLILIKVDLDHSYDSDFLRAYDYAKDHGAKVINCSWGSQAETQSFKDKLAELKNNGITVVFASGNGHDDLDEDGIDDESEDPSVIGVGATSENNDITSYSSYGSNIDILAPAGEDIGVMVATELNEYEQARGTSFSAPTVAGVIAMMYSLHPNLTFDEIYSNITQNADKVGIENGANYVNGFDKYRAYGKINVDRIFNSLGDL